MSEFCYQSSDENLHQFLPEIQHLIWGCEFLGIGGEDGSKSTNKTLKSKPVKGSGFF